VPGESRNDVRRLVQGLMGEPLDPETLSLPIFFFFGCGLEEIVGRSELVDMHANK